MPLPRHRKVLGELAEARFVPKALGLGFRVAKPFGDSAPYDFLVEKQGRVQRVQVKSTSKLIPHGCRRRSMVNSRGFGCHRYNRREIDFIAAYVFPSDAWYIIPIEVVGGTTLLYLYPEGGHGRFERFREAWHLLWQK